MKFTWTVKHSIEINEEQLMNSVKNTIKKHWYCSREDIESIIAEAVDNYLSSFDDEDYYDMTIEVYEKCAEILCDGYLYRIEEMIDIAKKYQEVFNKGI